MNDPNQQLIWKYLENQCSPGEIEKVHLLLSTDKEVKELVEQTTALHEILKSTSIQKAPIDLQSNVMRRLQTTTAKGAYKGIGMQPLVLFLSAITLIIVYYGRHYQLPAIQFDHLLESYVITNIPTIDWALPSFGPTGFYIAVALLAIPCLYFIDRILEKRNSTRLGIFLIP